MSAVSPAFAILIAVVAAGALAALEWRRRDERHRAARIAASVAAATALVLLGAYRIAAHEPSTPAATEAALWTANAAETALENATSDAHFALPRASVKPAGATVVPDVAYIRRHFPEVRRLRIVGGGLEPFELNALAGLELVFDETSREPGAPAITFLLAPRELPVGEPLRLQGRIGGLAAGEQATLRFAAPDGAKAEVAITGPAQTFEIVAPGPQSAGRFVWHLTAQRGNSEEIFVDEEIGVAVVRPTLARVLVLESSPRLETAHLQRWFAEIGGTLVARTTVGQERYRFASSGDGVVEFHAINRELLVPFDIVVVDLEALDALAPAERDALETAVRDEGLGVLVRISSAEPISPATQAFIRSAVERDESAQVDDALRTARLQWRGLGAALEHPVAVAAVRVQLNDRQQALVTDTQQRPIVVSGRHGQGQVALTIARDTWRWRLHDQNAVFAGYWSHLLGELAKPRDLHAPQWAIENPPSAPLIVDQPVQLRLSGAAERTADVRAATAGEEPTALPLAEDPAEPTLWRTTFWPRKAGWHRVQLGPDGAHLDFHVHDRGAWASLAPARRTAATRTAAATQKSTPAATAADIAEASDGLTIAGLYALFLLGAGYLWFERRRAAA